MQIIATLLAVAVLVSSSYGAAKVPKYLGDEVWVLVNNTVTYGDQASSQACTQTRIPTNTHMLQLE
jgi:hypothetical protein